MPEDIETRPFENEHACRLRPPGDFKDGSFRRTTRKHEGKTYSVIMGKLKGEDSMTEQAYRYKKDTWSASDARAHCKDHSGSFEAAKDSKAEIPEGLERRILAAEQIEMRVEDDDKPKLVGYAARYNSWTDLMWFKERIKAGAFDEAIKQADVRCLKNHDPNLILGRTTNETLQLESNTVGLRFTDELPDTNTGRDVREEVRRGDISGCSFAFTVAEDDWKYFDDDRPPERTIVKIGQLFDVGPVTYPAYPDTTVAARSLDPSKCVAFLRAHKDEIKEIINIPEEKKDEITDPERCREIERGYRKAGRIINRCKSTAD